MAYKIKHNETRGYPTHYRGPLVICSTKGRMDELGRKIWDKYAKGLPAPVYGCALCIVWVRRCIPTSSFVINGGKEPLTDQEFWFGNYQKIDRVTQKPRYAWMTEECYRLPEPIPVKGKQGFFFLPLDVSAQIRNALNLL